MAVSVFVTSLSVSAQTSPGDPASRDQTIPEVEKTKPLDGSENGLQSGRSGSLSDKLNSSNGVIKPPSGVDPGIEQKAPAPHPNSTPVIPQRGEATPK